MTFTESQFIAWATAGGCSLPVGPGDDGAVLADGTVLCVDTIVEGVHFESSTPLELVATKALGSCLSDVCAMGAVAEAVLVAAQLPPGTDGEALAGALASRAAAFGVALAGGDTVRAAPGALALSVTAVGRCAAGDAPWLRSGARPDDVLVVSGPLGGSRAGRHLHPRPRADVVAALRASATDVHACLDLSDGLARDLPRLCAASDVGACIQAGALPLHDDTSRATDRVAAALGDGEDFELLLAVAPGGTLGDDLVAIGVVTAARELVLVRDGVPGPWPPTGYEHVF